MTEQGVPVQQALREATQALAAAGVASPRVDAEMLLAHVLGVPRSRLMVLDGVPTAAAANYAALIARRSAREPLQHLTGVAHFRHVELAVGPGVFVPRPETELLAGWAIERAQAIEGRSPVVLDLCTGSGAIAKAIADEVPEARVFAVELDPGAAVWAARNLTGTGVDFRVGVDVIACNPPYIPLEAWESVAQEARDHDPDLALFSGADGLDAMRVLERTAAILLRPGGWVGAEHAEVQHDDAPRVFGATGRWREVRDHPDLTGRARYLTARLG